MNAMTEPALCRCGCGTPTAYDPHKRAYNKYAGDTHRFAYQEQQRRAKIAAKRASISAPLCACGCGTVCGPSKNSPTGWLTYAAPQHRWRAAHHRYWGKRRTPAPAPPRFCACGCGQPLTGVGQRRYVEGHYQRPDRRPDTGPLKDDLTPAQIEAIIAHHRQVQRYERNRRQEHL